MKMQEAKIIFYPEYSKQVSLKCEIAKSLSAKMKGLMHRESLPNDEGMLFLFMFSGHRFFWMKNVKIPLDLIFINKKLEIITIYEAPIEQSIFHKIYWSRGFCKYVVECNRGFCKEHGISKGNRIEINR